MSISFQRGQRLLDVLIRAGLIAVLALSCYDVFHPFLNLMLWALILAVTLYPLHRRLKHRLGFGEGRTATLLVVLLLAVLLVPTYLMGAALATSAEGAIASLQSGSFHIPPPAESVASWPVVGKWVYGFWDQAATDLTGLLHRAAPLLKDASLGLLSKMAGIGLGVLMFIGAIIIAGVIMAYGEDGAHSALRITTRLTNPDKGAKIVALCTATIRAVAQGVVGIAFIQMLLVGLGFVIMDLPGAGLLALVVLLLGIMQLPATLVTLPVIGFVLATQGATAGTIVFAIYTFVAGMVDNVLKPLLLGRGVDVPMPVVLIGALGGMVINGVLGLFTGPVILAVGYKLFWQWVDDQPPPEPELDSPGA